MPNKRSFEEASLYTKFIIAAFFMFALPVLLVAYVLIILPQKHIALPPGYENLVIICIVVSGVFGYLLVRKTARSILNVIKRAKSISEGKVGGKVSEMHQDELRDLARAFNKITSDLERKIAELESSRKLTKEMFQKIGYAVTSGQQLDTLLSIIIQSMAKVLNAEGSLIALYNKNDGKLYIKDYFGPQKNLSNHIRLPDDKGVIGLVIKNAKPMMLEKAGIDSLSEDELIRYNNISCIPIMTKGKVIGVLAVIDQKEPEQVMAESLPLLENISGQIATSIGNFELNKDIEKTYYETLITLARVVEAKDHYTKGHVERVATYVEKMAERLKLDDESKKVLMGGAILHDLGKVGVSDSILKKEGIFTPEEREIMKQHTIIGESILKPLRSMEKLSKLVRHHHELYDGSGYPDGLKGEAIPILSRILTIADIYDALTTARPYRKADSKESVLDTLKSYAGNKLDPKLVDVFIELMKR